MFPKKRFIGFAITSENGLEVLPAKSINKVAIVGINAFIPGNNVSSLYEMKHIKSVISPIPPNKLLLIFEIENR